MSVNDLLLAGPIVRRVEPRLVSAWVALNAASSVKLDLYNTGTIDVGSTAGHTAQTTATPLATATASTLRVGDKLHVAVVMLELQQPAQPLMAGGLYSYNLTFTPSGGAAQDLRSLGLLAQTAGGDEEPLGYVEGRLPSFALAPATIDGLRVVHTSCAKLSGEGEPLMQHLDDIIKDSIHDPDHPEVRPHQLLLTGDQIYADDLATALLPALSQLGETLLGVTEKVPIQPPAGSGVNVSEIEVTQTQLPAGQRQTLVAATAGMTTTDGDNQLIGFGEYAALYLLTWSPTAWPDKLAVAREWSPASNASKFELDLKQKVDKDRADDGPSAPIVLDAVPHPPDGSTSRVDPLLTPLYPNHDSLFPGRGRDEIDKLQHDALLAVRCRFLEHKKVVSGTRKGIWKVRRALANVPVYMMCDDHEITDDWFLNQAWRNRVLGNPLGKAIIRNGLLAFVLFQSWGNDPKAYTSGPRQQLLQLIPQLFPSGGSGRIDDGHASTLDALLGLNTAPPQVPFHFSIDGPAHRVLVLDTRNHREYRGVHSPPNLLSAQAMQDQIPQGPLPAGLDVLLVVSPPQVFGPQLFDLVGQPGAVRYWDADWLAFKNGHKRSNDEIMTGIYRRRPFGELQWDYEGWQSNQPALEDLLARLSSYSSAIFLCGDVHYASSFVVDYYPKGKSPSRFVCFTCSPAQNQMSTKLVSFMNHSVFGRQLAHLAEPVRRIGWQEPHPDVLDDTAGEPPTLLGRLRRAPVLLSATGWKHPHAIQRAPDWFWDMTPIDDTRPDDQRPDQAQPSDLAGKDLPPLPGHSQAPATGLLRAQDGQITFPAMTAAHQQSMDRMFFSRTLVFSNNLAMLSFKKDGQTVTVSQTLYSLRPHPRTGEDTQGYTLHTATLTPTAAAVPASVGP